MDKTIILVTGPIGAGKSTFIEIMMKNNHFFTEFEFISTDLYFGLYFHEKNGNDSEDYAKAKKYCWYKLNKSVSLGNSFIWETVVAKEDKIDFLKKCSNSGYNIICLFISVNNISLLTSRITERSHQGWYNIPQSKIENRLEMVMKNMKTLIHLSNEFIVIDASNGYKPIFSVCNKSLVTYEKTMNGFTNNLKGDYYV